MQTRLDSKSTVGMKALFNHFNSHFTSMLLWRLFSGVGSVLLSIILVMLLFNSPITGALETELLRWRIELQRQCSKRLRSKDIVIVYLDPVSPGSRSNLPNRDLSSLLDKIETSGPKVVGIDLRSEAGFPQTEGNLSGYSNLIVGSDCNQPDSGNTMSASLTGKTINDSAYPSTRFYVEENGMVAQLPSRLPYSQSFSGAVASFYRTEVDNSSFAPGSESLRFINYANLEFLTLASGEILSGKFDPKLLRNKIVLIGDRANSCIVPGAWVRIHKPEPASEILVQAFAIQTLIDDAVILPSSPTYFRLMLAVLIILGLLMPTLAHGVRFFVFVISLFALWFGSCLALAYGHIFIQVWPFMIGLLTSFIVGTVSYAITDLNERNRRLRQTQLVLEKSNLELSAAQIELESRNKQVARARELGMEEERKRVALDLHDDVLKELFLASSSVDKLADGRLEPTVAAQLQNKIHEASDKIRRIIANLSPSTLSVCGLPGAIENLADNLRKETSIEVVFRSSVGPGVERLDHHQGLLVYRIVQEAFNNIQKHSKATKVLISLSMQHGKFEVAISDNGIGLDGRPVRAKGHGLENMRYRAELLGAEISWSTPDAFSTGTQVIFRVSLPELN
jgi:signal transduction histidine kinase